MRMVASMHVIARLYCMLAMSESRHMTVHTSNLVRCSQPFMHDSCRKPIIALDHRAGYNMSFGCPGTSHLFAIGEVQVSHAAL